jgi:hypothetical protein
VLPIANASGLVYIAAAGLMLGLLGAFVAFRRSAPAPDLQGAAMLAAAFVVLLSPHYPWYFAWLVVFACLLPSASLWLTVSSFLLYLVPVGSQLVADRNRLVVESAIYVPFGALAAIEWWRRGRGELPTDAKHATR